MRRDVFQALADPTRRAIVLLLAGGSLTPNAIAEHFNSSRQAVSRHLQVMVECEVLKSEQQGREVHYHLDNRKLDEVEAWLEEFRTIMNKRFDQLDQVLTQLKKKKK